METMLEAIVARDHARLTARPREETMADAAKAAAGTPLGTLLTTLPAGLPFTLHGVSRALTDRRGDLTDAESIFLFLHQFDEMYVREARA